MQLKLFAVRDVVTNESGFIFPAKNEGDLKRTIKSAIVSKSPVFADNMQDKQIYAVGELDTSTGVIVGLISPIFMLSVQEVCDELILEIKAHNQKMKEAGLDSSVIEEPKGEEDGRKEEN